MCVKVVRNPETPTRLNAAFSFRPPDPPAGGCRRKIAGPPRNPSARYVASMATLRDVAGIGPDPQYRARRNKKCISAGRPPAAASRFVLFLCCRNPRHRYVTAAFRPAKQNSSRPPHVLSITPRMSSESGGGGRSTVSKGNGPSLRHLGLVGSPCVLARSSKQQANTMWWATNVIPMTSIFYIYVGISTFPRTTFGQREEQKVRRRKPQFASKNAKNASFSCARTLAYCEALTPKLSAVGTSVTANAQLTALSLR